MLPNQEGANIFSEKQQRVFYQGLQRGRLLTSHTEVFAVTPVCIFTPVSKPKGGRQHRAFGCVWKNLGLRMNQQP
jgi:hypothetical protein